MRFPNLFDRFIYKYFWNMWNGYCDDGGAPLLGMPVLYNIQNFFNIRIQSRFTPDRLGEKRAACGLSRRQQKEISLHFNYPGFFRPALCKFAEEALQDWHIPLRCALQGCRVQRGEVLPVSEGSGAAFYRSSSYPIQKRVLISIPSSTTLQK